MSEEVSPHETLMADVQAAIQRYVVLPSHEHGLILAIWAIHTWLLDAAQVTPYIYVYSTEPGSGKTRLLETMMLLSRNARRGDDMTVPIIFKVIERDQATLFIDEFDCVFFGARNELKRGIINSGYRRGGSAWRMVAGQPEEFSTFSAKLFAGLNNGMMPDTIRDRSIPIKLSRKATTQRVERFTEREVAAEFEPLLDRIEAFKQDHLADVMLQIPEYDPTLSDRQNEIADPLVALATVLGRGSDVASAIRTVLLAETQSKALSPQQVLLQRISDAFGDEPKIFTDHLCEALGRGYTGRMLAIHLEKLGIRPRDIRIRAENRKGYLRSDFEDAFDLHLGLQLPTTSEPEAVAA